VQDGSGPHLESPRKRIGRLHGALQSVPQEGRAIEDNWLGVGTKKAQVIRKLQRSNGASITEIMRVTQ
jgi:hypothetical protein